MKPLLVVAFLDGSLGHEKQTIGVLDALLELTPIDVKYRKIPKPSFKNGLQDWVAFISSFALPRTTKKHLIISILS